MQPKVIYKFGSGDMKVILKQDIKGVGKKDQIINASDGYAQNFLFPKNLAVPADKGNMSKLQAKKDSESFKKGEEKKQAEDIAKKIENIVLEIKVKAGESGKIFGSITSKEIADNLESQYKIKIDKKRINLKEPIKSLGSFTVEIRLFEGVIAKLKILIK